MLNLNELDAFVHAAEYCNFSAAARHLHMTQPAVSLQIAALERHLHTQLFWRRGKAVYLSDSGRTLVPLARHLLAEARRVEEAMRSLGGEPQGPLAIACTTTSGKYLLPHLVAKFRAVYPRVSASIHVSGPDWAMQKLRAGEVHLCVMSTRTEQPDVEVIPLFTDKVVLIAPRWHRWATSGEIAPKDLLGENMLVREPTSGTRRVTREGLAAHGIAEEDLTVEMELGNAEAIALAVEAGIGVAFISALAAAKSIALGLVRPVTVTGLDLERPIDLLRSRQYPATAAQDAFWQFVQEPASADLLTHGPLDWSAALPARQVSSDAAR